MIGFRYTPSTDSVVAKEIQWKVAKYELNYYIYILLNKLNLKQEEEERKGKKTVINDISGQSFLAR